VLAAIDRVSGHSFNLGGGPANAVSLRTVLNEIEALLGHPVVHRSEGWRKGDQLYFVADTRTLTETVSWHAKVGWREGLCDLVKWIDAEVVPSGRRNKMRARQLPA
jgi:CDP-paratose 2-epimerase